MRFYLASLVSLAAAVLCLGCGTAQYADTAPSGTSLEDQALLRNRDLDSFVTQWLVQKGRSVSPRYSSSVEFIVSVQPPPRAGYRNVGMREADDALAVFSKWCSHSGGKAQLTYDLPKGTAPSGSFLACLSGNNFLGAIGTAKDRNSNDGPVVVHVFAYTPKSVAKAKEDARREALAEYEAGQRRVRSAQQMQADIDVTHRARLKIGDYVSWAGTTLGARINGLVIELKPPLSFVQFPELRPNTTIWVRIEELGAPR